MKRTSRSGLRLDATAKRSSDRANGGGDEPGNPRSGDMACVLHGASAMQSNGRWVRRNRTIVVDLGPPDRGTIAEAREASAMEGEVRLSGSVGAGGANQLQDVIPVQVLLNTFIVTGKLTGIGPLATTGSIDAATVDAIRAFQRKYVGLQHPDGRVDPAGKTLARLNGSIDQPPGSTSGSSGGSASCHSPSPLADVSANLGASALGFCSRTLRRYGVPETIQALLYIGTVWHNWHPDGPIIIVSDVSKCGGGKIPPHGSHRIGLDVDLGFRIKRTASCNSGERVCTGGGGRKQTADYVTVWRPVIKELIEVITSNPYLPVKIIWFKDKELERLFRRADGTRLVSTSEPGHDCHLHVRFCMPARYRSSLALGAVYGSGEQRANYSCD